MSQLIEIKELSAGYQNKTVLRDVNLTIFEQDFIGIVGPNGGGKTTLIKCVLGLLKPFKGELIYQKDLRMGYLPQYSSIDRQFPISVEEVVLSGLKKKLTARYTAEDYQKAQRIIEQTGLEGLEKRSIEELSGGQLQRALLGRAIISDPSVLILDEPNTYIDRCFEMRLYELLKEINRHCAILLVTHNLNSALEQAKSIAYVSESLSYCPHMPFAAKWLEKLQGHPIHQTQHDSSPTKCCF